MLGFTFVGLLPSEPSGPEAFIRGNAIMLLLIGRPSIQRKNWGSVGDSVSNL